MFAYPMNINDWLINNYMSAYNPDVAFSVDARSRLASKQLTQRYEESSIASEENEFLKAYQHTPNANNSFAFPAAEKSNYRTINVSKLTERQALSPSSNNKKSIIDDLSQKNEMLQKEVERVDKILSLGERRKTKRLPELDGRVVKKQLQNAYKQIRIYQNDVEQRKKYYEHEGVFVDIIRKAESTLLERQDLVKKLQAEISELKKQSNQFVKLLQDGHIKKEYTNKSSRLHKEIKMFEKQMQDEEKLALSDYYNSQQKNKRIFEMEQELIKNGFDQRELANLKTRLDQREKGEKGERKNTVGKKDIVEKRGQRNQQKGEDRSKKAFNDLKTEITLIKKMHKDYCKKIEELQSEKQEAEYKSQQSKKRLDQTEREIIRLQEMFQEMKRNVDPAKLKPLYKNGTFTESSTTQFGTGKGNPLQHHFTTDQLGQYNKKHTAANDRLAIGKKSAYIVQLTLFENRTQFLGFQAGYLIGQTIRKGSVNVLMRQNERFLKDKTMKLEPGDYFRFFEVSFNKDNIVTGFMAVSKNEKIIKAGTNQGNKREFFFRKRQYPCCLFGSYSNEGFQMLGVQKAEAEHQ